MNPPLPLLHTTHHHVHTETDIHFFQHWVLFGFKLLHLVKYIFSICSKS